MIAVTIVDDHPVFRQGLAMAIDEATDLELGGEAKSIEDFDDLQATPDVVLLDLSLPGIEGAAGVAHVCGRGHRVLVVSAAGTPTMSTSTAKQPGPTPQRPSNHNTPASTRDAPTITRATPT